MRRLARLLLLLLALLAVIVSSFYAYILIRKDSNAVPAALLAGITSIMPYHVSYAGPESDAGCLAAYRFAKEQTNVQYIEDAADSRYASGKNTVYLTREALARDTVEAVHEFGHALDRHLHQDGTGYFSRQAAFANAYAADCGEMQKNFQAEQLFVTDVYRNLAVSDMMFAVFYDDARMTRVLYASYNAAGVSYWHHERTYMSRRVNRQTEVFADIFTILLSDDRQAKGFLYRWFPASTRLVISTVEEKF